MRTLRYSIAVVFGFAAVVLRGMGGCVVHPIDRALFESRW